MKSYERAVRGDARRSAAAAQGLTSAGALRRLGARSSKHAEARRLDSTPVAARRVDDRRALERPIAAATAAAATAEDVCKWRRAKKAAQNRNKIKVRARRARYSST